MSQHYNLHGFFTFVLVVPPSLSMALPEAEYYPATCVLAIHNGGS